jgi:hypothetical protein
MTCPSHPPWFHHPNNIWSRVQVLKLLVMQISPASCHFLSLRSNYFPQHPILKWSTLYQCSSLRVRVWRGRHYSEHYPTIFWQYWRTQRRRAELALLSAEAATWWIVMVSQTLENKEICVSKQNDRLVFYACLEVWVAALGSTFLQIWAKYHSESDKHRQLYRWPTKICTNFVFTSMLIVLQVI